MEVRWEELSEYFISTHCGLEGIHTGVFTHFAK